MSNRLTRYILVGLVLGIVAGYVCFRYFPGSSAGFAEGTALLPMAFLRLIKMIIAPLVFSTLVVGIAKMGDVTTVGRIGGKALGWFIFASLISLTLGLILVQLFEPGKRDAPCDPRGGRGLGRARRTRCRSRASSSTRSRPASSTR